MEKEGAKLEEKAKETSKGKEKAKEKEEKEGKEGRIEIPTTPHNHPTLRTRTIELELPSHGTHTIRITSRKS